MLVKWCKFSTPIHHYFRNITDYVIELTFYLYLLVVFISNFRFIWRSRIKKISLRLLVLVSKSEFRMTQHNFCIPVSSALKNGVNCFTSDVTYFSPSVRSINTFRRMFLRNFIACISEIWFQVKYMSQLDCVMRFQIHHSTSSF